MNIDISSLQKIRDSFLKELQDADAGLKTSLPYIHNPLPEKPLVQNGEEFQVIVIGGTHAAIANCKKVEHSCLILSCENVQVPQFTSLDVFLEFLTPFILPTTRILALNFAYPLIPVFREGRLDGTLLRGTKGHTFNNLIGKTVGEEIEKHFSGKLKVSVANDTICLLLSGLEMESKENLGAGIVGSGMNFAFFKDSQTAVNLESADFKGFPQSETGIEIDRESVNPGHSTYEKEVSGVYLYKHYNLKTSSTPILETAELDTLARNGDKVAWDLLQRSAHLISCQVAAIMDFKSSNLTFAMEGSVFWKGFEYKKTVEETSSELSTFQAKFIHIQNSNVIGAAHLVM